MSNGASPAQTQQLLEKFDTRLAAAHEKLRKFNETDKAYEELEGLLHSLPLKTSHKVKVPLSRKGFYIGDLTRTNELMILLGDNWFADCSASESLQVVSRRRSEIKATVDAVGKMISELDQNRKLFGSVLGAPVEKEIVETNELNEEGLPFVDIRVPFEDNEEAERGSKDTRPQSEKQKKSVTELSQGFKTQKTMLHDPSFHKWLDALEAEEQGSQVGQGDEPDSTKELQKAEEGVQKQEPAFRIKSPADIYKQMASRSRPASPVAKVVEEKRAGDGKDVIGIKKPLVAYVKENNVELNTGAEIDKYIRHKEVATEYYAKREAIERIQARMEGSDDEPEYEVMSAEERSKFSEEIPVAVRSEVVERPPVISQFRRESMKKNKSRKL